jgi:hypothetical protein
VQVSALVALFCWGLPATARDMCSDTYNTFDGNLQQTLFVLLCYAAVFCRVGTKDFVVLCALTVTNFIFARSVWSRLDAQPFALGFEAPKLIASLSIIAAGVRRTDLHLRRDFAARELMLKLIEEQGREMEDALEAAATRSFTEEPALASSSQRGSSSSEHDGQPQPQPPPEQQQHHPPQHLPQPQPQPRVGDGTGGIAPQEIQVVEVEGVGSRRRASLS